jgi:chromosome segregation ATPase
MKLTKENNILKTKYEELINEKKEYDMKIKNMEIKLRNIEETKNEEIQNLENKLKEFEDNYINNEAMNLNINKNSIISNQQEISQLTKDKIEELFSVIKNKIPALENKLLEREQKEIEERKQINLNIDKRINKIVKDFGALKEQFQNKENLLLKKQIEELNIENNKLKNKLKKIIAEKSEDKNMNTEINNPNKDKQILELKNIIDDLEQKISLVEENKKVTEEKYKYQRTLTNSLNDKVEELKMAKNSYKNFFLESEKQFKKFLPEKNLRELVYFNMYVDPDDIQI